jgi:hypothetical protein
MSYSGSKRNPQIITHIMTRIPIPPGQILLYKALYEVDSYGLRTSGLASRMHRRNKKELRGILGALGNRINHTTEALKQSKPGIEFLFNVSKYGDECRYSLRPEVREVIDHLAELHRVLQFTVEEIYKRYDRGRKYWLVVEAEEAAQLKIPY